MLGRIRNLFISQAHISVSDKRQTTNVALPTTARHSGARWSAVGHALSGSCRTKDVSLPVETERVTLRLPVNDLALLDALVEAGEVMNRSDAIRAAIRDFVRNRAPKVQEGVAARKTVFASADQAREIEEMRAALEELRQHIGK